MIETTRGSMEATAVDNRSFGVPSPGSAVAVVAWSVAVWCVGFAVINVVFEMTDHFAKGPYAEYAGGISVMDWLVVALKLLGAVMALLSLSKSPTRIPASVLAVMLWGAFATLGLDAIGSVVEAIGMVTGLTGSAEEITLASVAYVVFFMLGAAGYGVLAA